MGFSSGPYLKLVPLPIPDVDRGGLKWPILEASALPVPDVDRGDLQWPIPKASALTHTRSGPWGSLLALA